MSFLSSQPTSAAFGRRVAGLLAVLLALSAPPTRAQATLTLDDALRLAQERSRQLPAQDAAVKAAREMSVSAAQRPDPVIKGGLANLPIDGPDRFSITRDFMTMRSIGVMQEFTRAEKRSARSARFEREAEVVQAGRQVALAELRRETALAWLERHYHERMVELMQTMHVETALQIEAAEAAYRSGRGPQADVFAARSAVAAIDDRLQLMAREVATARTRLARWVGDGGEQTLAAPPELDHLPLQLSTLEAALQEHPQIVMLARKELLARAEADIARSEKSSDWSAEVMLSQRGPAYSNMLSLSVSIPLQWNATNRQDRELAARLALAQRERDEREEALREAVAATRSAILSWQSNRERLVQYDATLIPLAADRVRAALAAYRGAAGPLAALLEARRMEIDTRLERLRIELETAALWARLNYLIPDETRASGTKEQ